MDPLSRYYCVQSGHGYEDEALGAICAATPYPQRGHGLGSFLKGLFRIVKPVLLRGAKALGREALRTGANILTDLSDSSTQDAKFKDIVSHRMKETAKGLIGKLQCGGKRKRLTAVRVGTKKTPNPSNKKLKTGSSGVLMPEFKRDIFSYMLISTG